jgi:multidrug transporter EmrE-like cation transporter
MQYVMLVILVQALYSASDLVRKFILHSSEFDFGLLKSLPMWLTLVLSAVGFVIQLYVLKHYDLSRAITIMGSCAIVFSVILGIAFFREKFSLINYMGAALAVVAVVLVHVGHKA